MRYSSVSPTASLIRTIYVSSTSRRASWPLRHARQTRRCRATTRELMPQDLKIEIDQLSREQATAIAGYLAGVVGRAHARQMDGGTRRSWKAELARNRSKTLDAQSWLWLSVVEMMASHEAAYL